MGQRHQIYVKLPKVDYNPNNCNNRPTKVIGIHHQWLFGATAMRMLNLLIKFVLNSRIEYCELLGSNLKDAVHVLKTLYSVDHDKGYFHRTCVLEDGECKDPRLGDNNNGITIIDLSKLTQDFDGDVKSAIKYCFMSIGHLECLGKSLINNKYSKKDPEYKNLSPISATEWASLHYPDYKKLLNQTNERKQLKKDLNIANGVVEFAEYIDNLVKDLSQFKVLTLDEIKKIFPKMFK